jgi:hypothetical protein
MDVEQECNDYQSAPNNNVYRWRRESNVELKNGGS